LNQVARLKTGALASANDTIETNRIESDIEQARFDHQAKQFALQQDFVAKRDKLREEFHARVHEITEGSA